MLNGTNLVFIIAAPSGAGKTSLVKALHVQDPLLALSVSHTTRAPRPGEEQGVHYHYTNQQNFKEMVEQAKFLEHAEVFGNYYGTAEESVRAQLEQGLEVILEIDWQGACQVRRAWPTAISIFVLPPSVKALEQRLTDRKQDSAEIIRKRMLAAQSEIAHYAEFDYLVVNDDFNQALAELASIVVASRMRFSVQSVRQERLITDLLASPPTLT